MIWNLPNQLTIARIFIAAGFFVLLGVYRTGVEWAPALMGVAFVLFIIAGITDILDGQIARRTGQVTAFGRMVDPFVDKVLVVGAFVMLAGPNFALQQHVGILAEQELRLPGWLTGGMASAVQPWMVVVILAREFIVSAIRGYSESQGIEFPAIPAGKLKMLLQTIAICSVLFVLAWTPTAIWAMWVKIITVWLAVLITVLSGVFYIDKAKALLLRSDGESS